MAELPQRKIIRLRGYDYALAGAYFITICIEDKKHIFGKVIHEKMQLSPQGEVADNEIRKMSSYYDDVEIVNHVVMPNHIHMLIVIYDNLFEKKEHPKIGTIVGRYKTNVTKILGFSYWQDRFNDRIVRTTRAFNNYIVYMDNNPKNWYKDDLFSNK